MLLWWVLQKLAGFEPKLKNAVFLLCHQSLTANALWVKGWIHEVFKGPRLYVWQSDCKKT